MDEYHKYSSKCDGFIFDNYDEFENIIKLKGEVLWGKNW